MLTSSPINNSKQPEEKLSKIRGFFSKIYNDACLFKSKAAGEAVVETKLSPYAINNKIVKNEKLFTRELLIRANPLYGNKQTQKASQGTCVYNALNYIRNRYKQSASSQFSKERHIEKAFSECRRKSANLDLCSIRFKLLLDYWIEGNKLDQDSSKTTQEWIDFITLQASHGVYISSESCSKGKNEYLLSETYKHITQFIERMKPITHKSFTVKDIKECIERYFHEIIANIRKKILEQNLKLNLHTLVKGYFEERGIYEYSQNTSEFMDNLSKSTFDAFIQWIFFDQEAKLNGLYFLGINITKSISSLLDVIETNGPLVFAASGNIANPTKQSFIKSIANYPISEIEFNDDESSHLHAMVLVGGGIDESSKEFVYLIDPNDTFTAQSKSPVYCIPFDKFKNILSSYDGNTLEIHNKSYSVAKNYFVYSKNGLNLTRDPVLSVETESKPYVNTRHKR